MKLIRLTMAMALVATSFTTWRTYANPDAPRLNVNIAEDSKYIFKPVASAREDAAPQPGTLRVLGGGPLEYATAHEEPNPRSSQSNRQEAIQRENKEPKQ